MMTVDGLIANVGSANLNTRSLKCDEENNLVALDPDVVEALNAHFDNDLERSVRIRQRRWKRRSLRQRVSEKLVAPIRRLS